MSHVSSFLHVSTRVLARLRKEYGGLQRRRRRMRGAPTTASTRRGACGGHEQEEHREQRRQAGEGRCLEDPRVAQCLHPCPGEAERVHFFGPLTSIVFLCSFHLVSPLSTLHFQQSWQNCHGFTQKCCHVFSFRTCIPFFFAMAKLTCLGGKTN